MTAVILKDILPSEYLIDYIHKYQVFRFIFDKNVTPPKKFHAPRPEHCITFYIKDPQRFSYINSDIIYTYPQCVINGIYTIPIYRYGGNDFLAIKVILQPTTLFKLSVTKLVDLTNNFINAEDIWGREVSVVCEQLNSLNDLNKMLDVIEKFLINLISKILKSTQPIDKAANSILKLENGVPLGWLASQSCLSIRQFIRKFEERVGVSSKTFEQIKRFDKAFRLKNANDNLDWLSIALACGYYDYQHMVKDFREFTLLSPSSFYEKEKKSPERTFGLHEC